MRQRSHLLTLSLFRAARVPASPLVQSANRDERGPSCAAPVRRGLADGLSRLGPPLAGLSADDALASCNGSFPSMRPRCAPAASDRFDQWTLSGKSPMHTPTLMAVLAHPDDDSLGVGGTLAKYASDGVEVFLVTATRGDGGRYRGHRADDSRHPGRAALATIREAELRAAASVLGVREVSLLDYSDQQLDRATPREAVASIVGHLRRVRPDVVVTFGPDGAYGHPDHVAISQFTTAATVAAADAAFALDGAVAAMAPHAVSKLYYIAWPESTWAAYQAAFRTLISTVDGVERQATPWPDWAITTVIDTRDWWSTVWRAVSCHESQVTAYERLKELSPQHHEALWGWQSFYRVFSTVNGGRTREADLFEGISG